MSQIIIIKFESILVHIMNHDKALGAWYKRHHDATVTTQRQHHV